MKPLRSSFLKLHVPPIILALLTIIALDALMLPIAKWYRSSKAANDMIVVEGKASKTAGASANCEELQAEIELIGGLQSKKVLTIFGSSELQNLPYSSYNFLPDSAGIPVRAYGHAYQQNLSIACQLLAAADQLAQAKVCILLSPGWFQSKGSNIDAFLEFVRPNFLRSIIHNESLDDKYVMHIAKFVANHYSEIQNPSVELAYLKNRYKQGTNKKWLESMLQFHKANVKKVKYKLQLNYDFSVLQKKKVDVDVINQRLEAEFLKRCTSNKIFVEDSYYSQYLAAKGNYEKAEISEVPFTQEFEDFLMVVEILKKYNCDATFVLQPLNPYHYTNLQAFDTIRKEIKMVLDRNDFQLLDMFYTSTENYKPGILKDIMHPGDRGWMDINEFLINHYTR